MKGRGTKTKVTFRAVTPPQVCKDRGGGKRGKLTFKGKWQRNQKGRKVGLNLPNRVSRGWGGHGVRKIVQKYRWVVAMATIPNPGTGNKFQ